MRTEKQVLRDFKDMGYKITFDDEDEIYLEYDLTMIEISKVFKCYRSYYTLNKVSVFVSVEVHKLLHELFKIWGWLK